MPLSVRLERASASIVRMTNFARWLTFYQNGAIEMSYDCKRGTDAPNRSRVEPPGGSGVPGKRTLTEMSPIGAGDEEGPLFGSAPEWEMLDSGSGARMSGIAPGEGFDIATSGVSGNVPYQSRMESAFGTSFSDVRAYLGGHEAESGLSALGARAATRGNEIAFRESSPSEKLVAHELAHVVQQRNGGGVRGQAMNVSRESDSAEGLADAAAEAVVRGVPVPDVGTAGDEIYRAVETNGGTWDTPTYQADSAPISEAGERVGCHIELEFRANHLVESTKIGLIQTTKTVKSSEPGGPRDALAPLVGDPDARQLIMSPDQADPGRKIDRAIHYRGRHIPSTNPVYGIHNSPGEIATKLTDGIPTTGTSQWGSHEKMQAGPFEIFKPPVPARIDDAPFRVLEFPEQTYHHTFEAAAIALEGPIPANTYLGSVSWGWNNDASGAVTVDPVSIVKAGAPSTEFMGAAARWNAATFHDTSDGSSHDPVEVPMANADSGAVAVVDMATKTLLARIPGVTAEIAGLAAGVDRTNMEFELRALQHELGRRNVRVHVLVRETEDLGSDNVYVQLATGGRITRSDEKKLNDGQSASFLLPLADLLPLAETVNVKVYDADWPDSDDLISYIDWRAPWTAAFDDRPWHGAAYSSSVSFEK